MWRSKNPKQAKDKAAIYNSREWRELRVQKLRANPLCEVCQAEGYVTPAHAVHHRHPIEDSTSLDEMRRWAFAWDNLVSVCDACHARIHKEAGKGTKQLAAERAKARQERWADGLTKKFNPPPAPPEGKNPPPTPPEGKEPTPIPSRREWGLICQQPTANG